MTEQLDVRKYNSYKELEEHEDKHSFIAEALLVPNANKTDCNRLVMFTSQLAQTIVIDKPECPLVCTNFENQVGEHTIDGFKRSKKNYKVLNKIVKNENSYILIVQDENGYLDLIERNEVNWFTEHYGFKYNNDNIDSKDINDDIGKGEVLYKAPSYDEHNNFRYGCNLKTIYTTFKNLTLEDAIVISESTAKRMGYHDVYKIEVNVNSNDVLLNLYGDKDNYKPFPDIGEEIKNRRLISLRRVKYNTLLADFKDSRLDKVTEEDETFYAHGRVVDINIYSNADLNELKTQEFNKQPCKYIENDIRFRTEVVEALKDIAEDKMTSFKLSTSLIELYNKCKMVLDNNKWLQNSNEFNNFVIEFTIANERSLVIGSKISNRYGGKGVISSILPDHMMPVIEEGPFKGERAEIVLNALGVINRINPSQLYELEINFISKYIRYDMSKCKDLKDKEEIYFDYLYEINYDQYVNTVNFYNTLNLEERENFMNELIENGIPIIQPPFFNNIDLDTLSKLYNKYPHIKRFKFKGMKNLLVMGETYMLTLKHDPEGKLSARSTSFNSINGLPAKSKVYKEHKAPYPTTPIRVGEMETTNMELTGDNTAGQLLEAYSTNENMREQLLNKIIDNPFRVELDFSNKGVPRTARIARSFFKCLGLDIVDKEVEEE